MATVVGPFVNVIDKYFLAPIVDGINYLRSSRANVNDMQTVVRKLLARRDDKQSTLRKEENAGQVESKEARNWFNEVEAIRKEADAIEEEFHQGRCIGGGCVNCLSRYKLSKRSINLKRKAQVSLNDPFDLARPPSIMAVREIEIEPIEDQPSIQRMLQTMLDCIGDPRFGVIGVYGMGGVGKTTLAAKINNHFKENSCFETVIMVTVSATPNIRSIQLSIGKRIGLNLSNDSEDDARERLFDALKKKKFLLILDDVWPKLDLINIGIPHPRKNNKGSKILVTSRTQDACTYMDAEITMKLQLLSEAESWNLFVRKTGQHVITNNLIKCSAENIVGKCKGLPLAIVTVARAMANRYGVGEWENAAREMEQSATDLRGMKEEVLVPLKFSFDRLEDDMLRSLFLYCACFPEDYNISIEYEILNYCVGEGLVDRFGSVRAAMKKGEDLIASLKIACMLEDGEYKGTVRMHDILRELAQWITSSESDGSPKFFIRAGESFKEAPQANAWLNATRISLMYTQITELPELGEGCQNLTTLLLRYNRILTISPINFLQHMDHLSVLDLSDSQTLEYLPDSLSCLVNLRVLRLRWCYKLRAIPPALGMLQQLQVLDLCGCSLNQQILGSACMGGLSNLRCLDVSRTQVSIPAGVISSLLKLEELKLYKADNIRWKVGSENEKWDGIGFDHSKGQRDEGNIITEEEEEDSRNGLSNDEGHQPCSINFIDVEELSQLTHLTFLEICFQDIIISDWFKPLAQKMTALALHCCTVKQEAIQALTIVGELKFEKCQGLTCLPTGAGGLLDLVISDCEDIEKVLGGGKVAKQDSYSFQSVESLYLIRLPKLEKICVGVQPLNCFAQLLYIEITECHRLKMVFTKGMPRLFNNLEAIWIRNCNAMEVILEAEEEEDGEPFMEKINKKNTQRKVISSFPKLRILDLQNLPALAAMSNNHILHCPLLKHMMVINCPRLKKDSLHIRNAYGLLVIEDEEIGKGKVFEEEIQEI